MSTPPQQQVQLAELLAAISLATDLGTGQPMEHALRTCHKQWGSLDRSGCRDRTAIRLTRQLHVRVPEDGEVAGLLALMLLTDARRPARTTPDGELVPFGRAGAKLVGL